MPATATRSCTGSALLLVCLAVYCCSSVQALGGMQQTNSLRGPFKKSECVKTCHEVDCDQPNIKYGKYCGVGHGGCEGEEPCDAADACCKQHDDCVQKDSLLSVGCHEKFLECLKKVAEEGSEGFSQTCPYSVAIPTMEHGIKISIELSESFMKMMEGKTLQDMMGGAVPVKP